MAKVVEKMFLDPETLANPFPMMHWALDNEAILKIPDEEVYGVFSAELVEAVLKDPNTFSSNWIDILDGRYANDPEIKEIYAQAYPHTNVLLTTDPPIHTRHRKLVNLAFSRPRVDAMADNISSTVNRLIDDFINVGRCEFQREFAVPLPVRLIADQIGLADVPVEKVKSWSDAVGDRSGGMATREREVECAYSIVEFQRAMESRIRMRREQPTDDLLSDLVNGQADGEPSLTDNELMSILQQLMTAGNETTTAMLGMGMLMLLQDPVQLATVQNDPRLIPNMVEEMLRYESPVSGTFRVTTREALLGGVSIPANSRIMVRLAAANRDSNIFSNPNQFEHDRKNAQLHYAFGRGAIHVCIGSMLARRELALAFDALLSRLRNIRLVQPPTYNFSMIMRGLSSLEIEFEKAS